MDMPDAPVRVLLVEDDEDDYLLTRDLFAELPPGAYHLDRVASYEAALTTLDECTHDLYLVDYRLGGHTGLELLGEAQKRHCATPMIMLTGQREREVDILAMQAGAVDFLSKRSLDAEGLERSMRYALARKRLEDDIRQANHLLEERVRRRTAELRSLNDALHVEVAERKRIEEKLRLADRRKDEFLATLAHELRNPLAPLTAATQLLTAEPGNAEQVQQLVGMMSQQLEQLVRLIDDLVDVSRINSGKLQLRLAPAGLADVVQTAIDASRPAMEAARHTFDVKLPNEGLTVLCDKVRLAQVVSNLLINAAKYTPPEGRIELVLANEGGQAVITVRDDGIGIPPEMQTHIFELFAQVDSSSTRSHGGLGIGLTIVRTLVELHGGTICCASGGPGEGSAFEVRMPLLQTHAESRANKSPDGNGAPLPELRVLIVDDNQSAAHLMSRLMQKLGQDVRVAGTGFEGLEQVTRFAPELIISDVAMPGMSGYEFAQKVRAMKLPWRPFLVAITGYGQEADKQEALAAGFDRHLTKPVGVSMLEELLRSRGGRR
jgi:signal transduction histidine kinase